MQLPLVSIAMCTYNGAKFLTKQLDSILAQTYTQLEVVIVDDGSTDDTIAIIQRYAANDHRVKLYQNDTNLGFNKNFEKAVGLTTGDYIAISDQDDIWLPEKIEELMNAIGDYWLVFSNSVHMDDDDNLLDAVLLPGFDFNRARDFRSMLLRNLVTGHTSLFNRHFLPHVMPFPAKGYYDWWMGFIALYHNNITYLDKVLTQYRIHHQSVIRTLENNDKKTFNKIEFDSLNTMLRCIIAYPKLKSKDRQFVKTLIKAINSDNFVCELKLISLLNKYYGKFFPDFKERKGLSRLNFSVKYARRFKT